MATLRSNYNIQQFYMALQREAYELAMNGEKPNHREATKKKVEEFIEKLMAKNKFQPIPRFSLQSRKP